MRVSTLIKALGGGVSVAAELGVSAGAVSNWVVADEIPPARFCAMWVFARRHGIDWHPPGCDEIARQLPPARVEDKAA